MKWYYWLAAGALGAWWLAGKRTPKLTATMDWGSKEPITPTQRPIISSGLIPAVNQATNSVAVAPVVKELALIMPPVNVEVALPPATQTVVPVNVNEPMTPPGGSNAMTSGQTTNQFGAASVLPV